MIVQGDSHFRCLSHLDTVLIASSLGPDSDSVVTTGAAVARAAGARIYLLHAGPAHLVAAGLETNLLGPDTSEEERRRAQLRDQAQRLGLAPGELAGLEVVAGTPHRTIVGMARQIGAGLIIVGASEPRGGLGKLLGSTADRVVRQAACPVLVVRGKLPVPPRRVLLPVDLSELSADAFRCGLHLVGEMAHGAPAEIEAFHALDFLAQLRFLHSDLPWETTSQQVEKHAAWELDRFIRDHGEETPVLARMRVGDARLAILAELEQRPADLLVLGTHGRTGFDRMLLGSVASAVLRQAPCSVLMIPPVASLDQATADAVIDQTAPAWHIEHAAAHSKEVS
jgi:nucleotide-binding universal stress UspA family protein